VVAFMMTGRNIYRGISSLLRLTGKGI